MSAAVQELTHSAERHYGETTIVPIGRSATEFAFTSPDTGEHLKITAEICGFLGRRAALQVVRANGDVLNNLVLPLGRRAETEGGIAVSFDTSTEHGKELSISLPIAGPDSTQTSSPLRSEEQPSRSPATIPGYKPMNAREAHSDEYAWLSDPNAERRVSYKDTTVPERTVEEELHG